MTELEKRANEIAKMEQEKNKPQATVEFQDAQNKYLQNQINSGKTINEIATDFAKATTINNILNGQGEEYDNYRKDLENIQKDSLKESFVQDKISGQTNTIDEKNKKAEAFYKSVRPILEFDFSNLIEDKQKVAKTVDGEIVKKPKTYSDRSYGIPLMVGMLVFLTIPYFIVSIILAILNGINAILTLVNTFGKISRTICLTLLIIFMAVAIAYCSICGIEGLFKVHIIHK